MASAIVTPEIYAREKIQMNFFGKYGRMEAMNLLNIFGRFCFFGAQRYEKAEYAKQ
jgi:hypothetical protein